MHIKNSSMQQIPFKNIQAVTLDVGNTLISINHNLIKNILKEMGIELPISKIKYAEAVTRVEISKRVYLGQSSETHEAFSFFCQCLLKLLSPASYTYENANIFMSYLKRKSQQGLLWKNLLPNTRKALENFRKAKLKMVAISNSNGTAENQLIKAGIREYFLGVIDSAIVKIEKPNPEIFYLALKNFNLAPSGTLHIGDIYAIDILGATQANLHAILLDPYALWGNITCHKAENLYEISKSILIKKDL